MPVSALVTTSVLCRRPAPSYLRRSTPALRTTRPLRLGLHLPSVELFLDLLSQRPFRTTLLPLNRKGSPPLSSQRQEDRTLLWRRSPLLHPPRSASSTRARATSLELRRGRSRTILIKLLGGAWILRRSRVWSARSARSASLPWDRKCVSSESALCPLTVPSNSC